MTESQARARRAAIRAEYAAEEAEAAGAEGRDSEQTVLSIRVPVELADSLRSRAAAEHVSASALARRILAQSWQGLGSMAVTERQVEEIVYRILRQQRIAH